MKSILFDVANGAGCPCEILIGAPFQIRDTFPLNVEFCTIVDIRI